MEVDFTVGNVKLEITGPQWSHIERKAFLLNGENLSAGQIANASLSNWSSTP
jgi:hypothetical protein